MPEQWKEIFASITSMSRFRGLAGCEPDASNDFLIAQN
jgi:hypothetical protein